MTNAFVTLLNKRKCSCYIYLYISPSSDLDELLLILQGLVHLVVGHAEHAQLRLRRFTTLREHDKVGDERNEDGLGKQL